MYASYSSSTSSSSWDPISFPSTTSYGAYTTAYPCWTQSESTSFLTDEELSNPIPKSTSSRSASFSSSLSASSSPLSCSPGRDSGDFIFRALEIERAAREKEQLVERERKAAEHREMVKMVKAEKERRLLAKKRKAKKAGKLAAIDE